MKILIVTNKISELLCLPYRCLCVWAHHVSILLLSPVPFIHYSQLRVDWDQGAYHCLARGRERWKGRNVQLDQQEGFICTSFLMCVFKGSWEPRVWMHDSVCVRCACRAHPLKSLILIHRCRHSGSHNRAASPPLSRKMSRVISFPLPPVGRYNRKPPAAKTVVGILTWSCRAEEIRGTWQSETYLNMMMQNCFEVHVCVTTGSNIQSFSYTAKCGKLLYTYSQIKIQLKGIYKPFRGVQHTHTHICLAINAQTIR